MAKDWWAAKLGGAEVPRATQVPQRYVSPADRGNYPQTQHIAEPPPMTTKARSALNTDSCPDCGSGNYVGTGETRKRCYDCGYPLVQSGTGMIASASSTSGPPQQARQPPAAGYHPEIIIGRIS